MKVSELKNGVIRIKKTELENPTTGDVFEHNGNLYTFQKETKVFVYYKLAVETNKEEGGYALTINSIGRSGKSDSCCADKCCNAHVKWVVLTIAVLASFALTLS